MITIYILDIIVVTLLIAVLSTHKKRKQRQIIIYSNGIDRTTYSEKRPSFNQWMR